MWLFLIVKIFIIISNLSFNMNIISNIKILLYYLESQKEYLKNDYIFKQSNNLKLKIVKKFKKNNNPVISIISPIYNSEKYILRFIKSIQSQKFINLEIILIDDYSNDNSVQIITKYKKKDQRIILIKNKKNKGTFINRNLGVLYSKGKYIIIPDPDDIITNNILKVCYKLATKYKIEMIRFNIYMGNGKIFSNDNVKKIKNRQIYQPELSTFLVYGINELKTIDFGITNKFIKKEVYIRSLKSLNNFYLNMYITFMEDSILNFIFYHESKSFIFIKKIGYYYIKNGESISNNLFKANRLKLKFSFIFLKIIFEFSKNNKYEKDIINHYFSDIIKNFDLSSKLSSSIFNNDFYLYYNIIKIYLNSSFINNENKHILNNFKRITKKRIDEKNKKYKKSKIFNFQLT